MIGLVEALLTVFLLSVIVITLATIAVVGFLVYNIIRQEFVTDLDEDDV